MTTIINASNGATSGLITTADASGILQLQSNNGTPALTLNTTQALGVGTSPSYGTSGQALISQGSGASPTWGSAGAMTLISTQTVSNSASLSWTGLSGYTKYRLVITDLVLATNPATGDSLYLQYGYGATTWVTSGYAQNSVLGYDVPAVPLNAATAKSTGSAGTFAGGLLFGAGGNSTTFSLIQQTGQYAAQAVVDIQSFATGYIKSIHSASYIGYNAAGTGYIAMTAGIMSPSITSPTAIRIQNASANFSCTASLYGISS